MWYYITEDQICVYMTNQIKDVNDWLAKHQKSIISIYRKNDIETIVEVK